MHGFIHRMLAAIVTVAFCANASAAQSRPGKSTRPPARGSSAIIFVVAHGPREAFIDPVAMLRQTRLSSLPSAGLDSFSKLESRYFKERQKYRLLFGGGEAGAVTVRKQTDEQDTCLGAQAAIELQMKAETQSKIGGLVMGLATDSAQLGRKTVSRRFPTMGERSSVTELAKKLYRAKAVSAASLQNMNTVNMTAMDLNGDERAEIIATFSVKTKAKTEARHFLFVIAEPFAKDFKVTLSKYERVTKSEIPSGGTIENVDEYVLTEVLVDQLDIDRDGASEVITARKSWEGITYRIYKKEKAQWKKIYEAYNYRCAF